MKKSNKQKVLEALEVAKTNGVHSFDLRPIGGWRYAARINDLKHDGYEIFSKPEKRDGAMGCRYFLVDKSDPAHTDW